MVELDNIDEANRIFNTGLNSRKTGSTDMNATSSRSHLIFAVLIECLNKQTGQRTVGKLSLVDLAGSERVAKTNATAERLKEGKAINQSLSALGNVISCLSGKQFFLLFQMGRKGMFLIEIIN